MTHIAANKPGLLARIGAGLALLLAIVAGLALSAFFFGFFLIIAALLALWLGWQRWRIRKHLRKRGQTQQGQAVIIQGEYEVIDEADNRQQQQQSAADKARKPQR